MKWLSTILNWLHTLLSEAAGPPTVPPPPPTVPVPEPDPGPVVPPPTNFLPYQEELLVRHNSLRNSRGIASLTLNTKLCEAAMAHAAWMAYTTNMSHRGQDNSDVGDRVNVTGYHYASVGENIAMGYSSPSAVMQGWTNSSGHRTNMLNVRYDHVGFGLSLDRGGRAYWCTVLARPSTSARLQTAPTQAVLSGPLDGLNPKHRTLNRSSCPACQPSAAPAQRVPGSRKLQSLVSHLRLAKEARAT